MMNFLTFLVPVTLLPAVLVAQVVSHAERPFAVPGFDVARIVAADLDDDLRDDALLVLHDERVVRAVNPGASNGFFEVAGMSDVQDAVGVRVDGSRDLFVTVSPTVGLAISGLRGNGSMLTVPSNPTLWTDVERLRIGTFGGPVLAGIAADGVTVRVAALDLQSLAYAPLATLTFSAPLLDLELSKRDQDPMPHVVAVTAAGLERRRLDGSLIGQIAAASAFGSIVGMPGGHDMAWVRRDSEGGWELVLERDGMASAPLSLDFNDPALAGLKVTDIDVGFIDADQFADLVIGQSPTGAFAVLFGSPGGYSLNSYGVVDNSDDDFSRITPQPVAPIVASADGTRTDAVFSVRWGQPVLEVIYEVDSPQQAQGDGGEWIPSVTGTTEYLPANNGSVALTLVIPELLRDYAEFVGMDSLQVSVWAASGLVDPMTGEYSAGTGYVEANMLGDYFWDLRQGVPSGDAPHRVEVPVGLGIDPNWDHRHVLLLVRLARIDTVGPVVRDVTFSVPIWVAMDEPHVSQFFSAAETQDTVFDPGVPTGPVYPNGGSRNVGRYRPARPVFPGLESPPVPRPLEGRGTTTAPPN